MSDDATLDAFAADESDRGEGSDAEAGAEADGDDEPAGNPETPALTYTSSPDGDECAECGETVQNRWRAGEEAENPDALVCPDCKVW